MKMASSSRPFHKMSFYLDLKGSPYEATFALKLVKDLKLLGARHEPLFSKNVSFVVSNRVPLKSKCSNPAYSQNPFKSSMWSPLSPHASCPSPQLLSDCSLDYIDCSTYTNSPKTDQNPMPMSRGMALLKKATQKNNGTTDLLENCKRWGIKVYHVEKILSKVKKFKNVLVSQHAAEKHKGQKNILMCLPGTRKLMPPFIKVEDVKRRYKPTFREITSWTSVIDSSLSYNISQMLKQLKKTGSITDANRPVFANIDINSYHLGTRMNNSTNSCTKSFTKSTGTFKASDSTSVQVSAVVHTQGVKLENTTHVFKKQTPRRKSKSLYCEICHKNYVNLDEHMKTEKHKKFMSNPINFLCVQNVLGILPKKGDFLLSKGHLEYESNSYSDDFVSYCCPENLLSNSFGIQSPFLYSANEAIEFNNIDTEPYSFLDPEVISPSCSSPDSVALPFLEDSAEKNNERSFQQSDLDSVVNKKWKLDFNGGQLGHSENSVSTTNLQKYYSVAPESNCSSWTVNALINSYPVASNVAALAGRSSTENLGSIATIGDSNIQSSHYVNELDLDENRQQHFCNDDVMTEPIESNLLADVVLDIHTETAPLNGPCKDSSNVSSALKRKRENNSEPELEAAQSSLKIASTLGMEDPDCTRAKKSKPDIKAACDSKYLPSFEGDNNSTCGDMLHAPKEASAIEEDSSTQVLKSQGRALIKATNTKSKRNSNVVNKKSRKAKGCSKSSSKDQICIKTPFSFEAIDTDCGKKYSLDKASHATNLCSEKPSNASSNFVTRTGSSLKKYAKTQTSFSSNSDRDYVLEARAPILKVVVSTSTLSDNYGFNNNVSCANGIKLKNASANQDTSFKKKGMLLLESLTSSFRTEYHTTDIKMPFMCDPELERYSLLLSTLCPAKIIMPKLGLEVPDNFLHSNAVCDILDKLSVKLSNPKNALVKNFYSVFHPLMKDLESVGSVERTKHISHESPLEVQFQIRKLRDSVCFGNKTRLNARNKIVVESKYFSCGKERNLQILYVSNVNFEYCLKVSDLAHSLVGNKINSAGKQPKFQNCLISMDSKIKISPIRNQNADNPPSDKLKNSYDTGRWNLLLLKMEDLEIKSELIDSILAKCPGMALISITGRRNDVKTTSKSDCFKQPNPESPCLITILFADQDSSKKCCPRGNKSMLCDDLRLSSNDFCDKCNCCCVSNNFSHQICVMDDCVRNDCSIKFKQDAIVTEEPLNLCTKESKSLNLHPFIPTTACCPNSCPCPPSELNDLIPYPSLSDVLMLPPTLNCFPSMSDCLNYSCYSPMSCELNCTNPSMSELLLQTPTNSLSIQPCSVDFTVREPYYAAESYMCELDAGYVSNDPQHAGTNLVESSECMNTLQPSSGNNFPKILDRALDSGVFEGVVKDMPINGDIYSAPVSSPMYVVVDDADFDSSSSESEWDGLKSEVDSLCQSLCSDHVN